MTSTTETATPAVASAQPLPPHFRRNFWLGVANGTAYNVYAVVVSTEVVLALFVSKLTDSNLMVSLLLPIELGTWYFLQFAVSGHLQRRTRGLPVYNYMGVVRTVSGIVLAAATFVLPPSPALLLVFWLCFATNSVAAGVGALPFMNVLAKTIPSRRRGVWFGWRRFLGGALGLLGGLLVKAVLAPDFALPFPQNFGLLFAVGAVLMVLMFISFGLVIEPEEPVDPRRVRISARLARAARLPLENHNYARYLAVRVGIVVTELRPAILCHLCPAGIERARRHGRPVPGRALGRRHALQPGVGPAG